MTTTWPLIGRSTEMSLVDRALADPACGGVALIGHAGVGKTRLAVECLDLARARGLATVSLRATRTASSIPFAALAPLLGDEASVGAGDVALFQSVAAEIDARRGDERLVLAVDDAQELDDASAALLDQLVEAARVFVVLTVRTGHPFGDPVLSLWKDERVVRVDVAPLADADVGALATMGIGGPVEAGTLRALVSASGGNVLFLRELIQGAQESGLLSDAMGLWRLTGPLSTSPRLRDLIGERLRGLDEDEREALELVALGDPLELSLLMTLVDSTLIERLERRGLAESHDTDGGPEVRLAHPLYGEVVRGALSPARRARLCRQLAETAEGGSGPRPRDVLRVAVWRLDGGGVAAPGLSMQAARLAFVSGDYDLAGRLARSAWQGGGGPAAAHLLGEALDYAGRYEEAEAVLAEAWPSATEDRDRSLIALRRASNLFRGLGRAAESDAVVREALTLVTDPVNRRDLESVLANHLLLSGDVAGAIDLIGPLMAQPGDAAFAQASLDAGTGLALAGRTEEAISHTTRALAVRRDLADEAQLSAIGVYVVAQALALSEAGRLAEAGEVALGGYDVCVELDNGGGQAWFASVLGRIRLVEGRLVEAGHFFREVASLFQQLSHPGQAWGLGGLALVAGQSGETADGRLALDELDALEPSPVRLMDVDVGRGRAWVALAAGDRTSARAGLWEAVELARGWGQGASEAAALHDLVRIGDGVPAARALEALAERVDGTLMPARADHARAVLSGEPDDAARSSEQFEAIGANLLAAETAVLEARLALDRGLARRSTAALARSQRLVERCPGARTPGLADPGETHRLSKREHEVAHLAAAGQTSREIAEQLFVSVRTVDNHLQRVYLKLGVSGRAELPGVLGNAG